MHWLKRGLWKAGIALAGLLLLLVFIVWVPMSTDAQEEVLGLATPVAAMVQATPTIVTAPTADATLTVLNKEKLESDIGKVQSDIFWSWTAMGTIIIGLAGIVFGFIQFLRNRRDAQDKELKDREDERRKEIAAQDKELRAQAEERFKAAVTALGSENNATQVGGAILLRSFLNPEDKEIYGRYYTQIFDLAVAYLHLPKTSALSEDPNAPVPLTPLRKALMAVFKEAFPLARSRLGLTSRTLENQSLDASHIRLDNAFLAMSDLSYIWMLDASLSNAELYGANLTGATLGTANLSKASLVETNLSDAVLINADLSRADLEGANLRGADLRGYATLNMSYP